MVQDFSAIVRVDGLHLEGEAPVYALEGLQGRVLAAVPRGTQLNPLCLAVGRGECPEEVVGADSPSKRERVDLDVAGRNHAGHDLFTGGTWHGVPNLVCLVPAGMLVGFGPSRLDAIHAVEGARHGSRTHLQEQDLDVVWDNRHAGRVLVDPHVDLCLEVGKAWAGGLKPDGLEDLERPCPCTSCRGLCVHGTPAFLVEV